MDQKRKQEKALEAAVEPRQEMHAKILAGEQEQLRIRILKAKERETKNTLQADRLAWEDRKEILWTETEGAAKALMEVASKLMHWESTDMRMKRDMTEEGPQEADAEPSTRSMIVLANAATAFSEGHHLRMV